jgi:hypothetical protein
MNVPPDNSSSEQTWAGSVMKANDPSAPLISGFTAAGSPLAVSASATAFTTSPTNSDGAGQRRSNEAAHEAIMQAEDSDERVEARIQVGCTLNGAAPRLLDDKLKRDSVGSSTGRLPAPVGH